MFKFKEKSEKKEETEETNEGEPPTSFRPEQVWEDLCDIVETKGKAGKAVASFMRRLIVDSPVVLGFGFLCMLLYALDLIIPGDVQKMLGCPHAFQPYRPTHWVRTVTHVFAHSSLPHIKGNMGMLMLVGPSVENEFGSENLAKIMLAVAVSSWFAHVLAGRENSVQLGASGVVFALILLNSLVSATVGTVPLSFVITAIIWVSEELYLLFFGKDGVSHHAHLTGAIVGTLAGYYIHRQRAKERAKVIAEGWLKTTRQKMAADKSGKKRK